MRGRWGDCKRHGHHIQNARKRAPHPRHPRRTNETRTLFINLPRLCRPRRPPKRLQRLLRNITQRQAPRKPGSPSAVSFNKDDHKACYAAENAAFNPKRSAEKDEPEDERLEGEECAEAFEQPDLKESPSLRACASVDVTNQVAMGYSKRKIQATLVPLLHDTVEA